MLSFETIGPSDGEPLVFLHGLGASRTKTTSALNNLPDLHLIAPDLPGHGDSWSFDPATPASHTHLTLPTNHPP